MKHRAFISLGVFSWRGLGQISRERPMVMSVSAAALCLRGPSNAIAPSPLYTQPAITMIGSAFCFSVFLEKIPVYSEVRTRLVNLPLYYLSL